MVGEQQRRNMLKALLSTLAYAGLCACGSGSSGSSSSSATSSSVSSSSTSAATRTWKLGFAPLPPPRPTPSVVLQSIDQFSQRAELAAIHEELPWTDLLAGMTPDAILDRDKMALVNYLRGKGLQLYFMADLTDGLSRADEAPQLRAAGRSLTEPAVQQLYRDYVLAVVRKLQPEYLGLAAETNLIRAAAPANLYAAVKQAANAAAADLRAAGYVGKMLSTVQVETAWGVLRGNGQYAGINTDMLDFAFTGVLGLSSYPYLGYAQPEDIPVDYYSRLLGARTLPVMVLEGGWTSGNAGSITSSPEKQARYITRLASLLDSVNARALVQLMYADIDLAAYPPQSSANLPLFIHLGLTDSDFVAKPALAAWDVLHARILS
jgi:hypothetical protein